ncbi:MAG: diguanylate cyclase [Planctomycetes bacterium]|nr:diguanylate cyclase [Planctomycetota bacterium]
MKNAGKILLIEDELPIRATIGKILEKRGHEVDAFETAEEGWDAYGVDSYPIVLLDWVLPGMSGIELCRKIRLREKSRFSTIVIITSRDYEEDLQEALDAGADDYIIKPINPKNFNLRMGVIENRLKNRVRRELEAETNQKAHTLLQKQFYNDPLTGVFNRRHILDLANRELGRSRRFNRNLSVLLVDIDHIEKINEAMGHGAGDEAIRLTAKACIDCSRCYDLTGRTGSDKFMVILPETTRDEAYSVALRITSRIKNTGFCFNSEPLDFSVSCGVGETDAGDSDFGGILNRAEKSLQAAKRARAD